ncbi:hypothetical protein O181_048448 [Austropuccinia psidii MF-1]|uniref:Reverse transcriptase domain-containing protein n=1 Tax=Austropuccinia psidii MF-1 TaxID=1389203 RepID=A0A9Q3HKH8_9BASI|nr:hypothetical protein [Austropuccinia psidii MF-1]
MNSQSLLQSRDKVFKEIRDVGEDVAISSLQLFQGDMDLPPLSFHASLEEQWDEEEEPEEIEAVLKVVPPTYHQYLDVFSKVKAEKLPPHQACDHHIELESHLHLVGVIYSLSNQDSETLRAYISENEGKYFIRPGSSSTGAPFLVVKKKDGGLHLCVEYRKLNAVTKKNRYPVPLMNQLLIVFNDSTIFSKIAMHGSYNLLRIKEGYKHLTAFGAKYDSYEYLVMPFGLTNAPPSFQNVVDDIFAGFLDIVSVVYLDYIVVFFSSEEENVKNLASVLQILRDNNLFAKASNPGTSKLFNPFLALPITIGVSLELTALTSLLKKEYPFIFNEEALSQFQILKEAFTTAPILAQFNPSLPTIVQTGASDYALGAVMSQVNDSGKHPIACDS